MHTARRAGRHFVDRLRVRVQGGHGGDGCVAFLREAFRPHGPPAGGNGGHGGDVRVVASDAVSTLRGVRAIYTGRPGTPGQGRSMHGKHGDNLILEVPLGTVIREIDSADTFSDSRGSDRADDIQCNVSLLASKSQLSSSSASQQGSDDVDLDDSKDIVGRLHRKYADQLVEDPDTIMNARQRQRVRRHLAAGQCNDGSLHLDLTTPGATALLVAGGRGGLGNISFSSTHHGSRHRTLGQPGVRRLLQFELKTIADMGLVGLPNAGKSTLLTAVSNATPEVADYPFTTLNPFLGTVTYSDAMRLTIADIPGLIAGAHRNVGLGHDFLRHIERSKVLVYVLDASSKDPVHDLETLMTELELYRRGMTRRPAIIVANKADVIPQAKSGLRALQQWTTNRSFMRFWSSDWRPDINLIDKDTLPLPRRSPLNDDYHYEVNDNHITWKVVPVSAKYKANIAALLIELRLTLRKYVH